jgi:3-hydroxybutyryl-CoA dehydratase
MKFSIGDAATFSKTLSESDLYLYAGITGDLNPIHVDEEYAKTTRYKRRIAHGLLPSSFICPVLGTKLPGEGTIHISQELYFLEPVFIGDTLTVRIEFIEIINLRRWKMKSQIFNQNNVLVVDGFSVVKPPKF